EAAGIDEVALEVDHDEGRRPRVELELVWVRIDLGHRGLLRWLASTGVQLPLQSATICVPVRPATASARWSGDVITTSRPPCSRKAMAASIFGPMLPGGNSPASRCSRATFTVMRSRFC